MTVRMEDIEDLCLIFSFPVHGESIAFTMEFADLVLAHLNQRIDSLTGLQPFRRHPSLDNSSFIFRGLHSAIQSVGKETFVQELSEFALSLESSTENGDHGILANASFSAFMEYGFELSMMDETSRRTWFSGVVRKEAEEGVWTAFSGPIPRRMSLPLYYLSNGSQKAPYGCANPGDGRLTK